jgi:catalase
MLGKIDETLDVELSLEAAPSCLWDALIVPGGAAGIDKLSQSGHTREFLSDQLRHCKTVLLLGEAARLLDRSGAPVPEGTPGILVCDSESLDEALQAFQRELAKHRHFDRESDPPRV